MGRSGTEALVAGERDDRKPTRLSRFSVRTNLTTVRKKNV